MKGLGTFDYNENLIDPSRLLVGKTYDPIFLNIILVFEGFRQLLIIMKIS